MFDVLILKMTDEDNGHFTQEYNGVRCPNTTPDLFSYRSFTNSVIGCVISLVCRYTS